MCGLRCNDWIVRRRGGSIKTGFAVMGWQQADALLKRHRPEETRLFVARKSDTYFRKSLDVRDQREQYEQTTSERGLAEQVPPPPEEQDEAPSLPQSLTEQEQLEHGPAGQANPPPLPHPGPVQEEQAPLHPHAKLGRHEWKPAVHEAPPLTLSPRAENQAPLSQGQQDQVTSHALLGREEQLPPVPPQHRLEEQRELEAAQQAKEDRQSEKSAREKHASELECQLGHSRTQMHFERKVLGHDATADITKRNLQHLDRYDMAETVKTLDCTRGLASSTVTG